ncbi:MAG TPA: hypothetical protein VFU53_08925, partial [Burkholderiales bacterium]|nr:hypothetical protein [Burkholderiales bacterium]
MSDALEPAGCVRARTRGKRGGALIAWLGALAVLALWAAVPGFASRSIVDMLVFAGLYTIAGLGVSFL